MSKNKELSAANEMQPQLFFLFNFNLFCFWQESFTRLPAISFKLNGKSLSLPPEFQSTAA